MDADGNFVVVWSSNGQDGDNWGIYGQRYNAAGVAQGSEFRVNTTTAKEQEDAAVAVDANGNFVITWSSRDQDNDGWGVYAQLYNGAGVAQGGELHVSMSNTGDQLGASVAADGNGGFVAVWSGSGAGDAEGVFAQRYDADRSHDLTSEAEPDYLHAPSLKHAAAARLEAGGAGTVRLQVLDEATLVSQLRSAAGEPPSLRVAATTEPVASSKPFVSNPPPSPGMAGLRPTAGLRVRCALDRTASAARDASFPSHAGDQSEHLPESVDMPTPMPDAPAVVPEETGSQSADGAESGPATWSYPGAVIGPEACDACFVSGSWSDPPYVESDHQRESTQEEAGAALELVSAAIGSVLMLGACRHRRVEDSDQRKLCPG
jgi:hypothetical protein